MVDDNDELIARVRAVLAPLPSVPPFSVARVLAATAGRTPRVPTLRERLAEWIAVPRVSLAGAGALVAVAVVASLAVRGGVTRYVAGGPAAGSVAATAASAPTLAAGANRALVAVQFVLDDARASSVTVIGDFNNWQATATPMRRIEQGQPWTAVAMIPPGRHQYAFLVDGTRWVADPRAPSADDADFGKPGSALLVRVP